mmetsp:Transcript_34442/g.82178  ORF Transcript_34442/g.82178 Transcript_34442/m.82178 type:complete len:481 (+) Transcript_34442:53-1495(+)
MKLCLPQLFFFAYPRRRQNPSGGTQFLKFKTGLFVGIPQQLPMARDRFASALLDTRSRGSKNIRRSRTVIISRRNPWPFATFLLCGSIVTMPRSVRSFSLINMPGFIHCTSLSIFSNARTVHTHPPNIVGMEFANSNRVEIVGMDWVKQNPLFFPIGNARRATRLRGGWMQSDSVSGKRPLQTESADSSAPAQKASKKGAKAQLIDVDANGTEISRRDKGPGRVASGYKKRVDGNWYKSVSEAKASPDEGKAGKAGKAGRLAAEPKDLEIGEEVDINIRKEEEEGNNGALVAAAPETSQTADALGREDDARIAAAAASEEATTQGGGGGAGGWTQQGDVFTVSMGGSLRGNLNLIPRPEGHACWDPPPREWVVFSDLHVSRTSLSTCLEVLERVHEEAVQRQAGVIFLGDFWHEKGILRIEPLNAVLQALSTWTVPLIALPGNHDQATLDGTAHALVPLALVLPSAYIISQPTVLLNARR